MEEFENRLEKVKYAKVYHLWAMGVGAVIAGDFFGWQACLAGGFAGACIALAIVTVLYVLLSFCIAELASHNPGAGGPYSFVTEILGRPIGFLAGLAESLNLLVATAIGVVGMSAYMVQITGTDAKWEPLWWFSFFLIFTVLNIAGVKLSFNIELVFTVISLLLLSVFYCGSIPKFDFGKNVLGNCNGTDCPRRWLWNEGVSGIAKGLSFSLWFYLGIEELPMVTEETIDASRTMPIGLISSIFSLVVVSFLTLLLSSAVHPGAYAIWQDTSPILTGYRTVFNNSKNLDYFSWILLVGIIASFHSFLFCTGRMLYAIARDGLFPSPLALISQRFKTPYVALIAASSIGYSVTIVLYYAIGDVQKLASVMINLALLGALVSYILQCVSYIKLKRDNLNPATYHSPFHIPGAVICILLCILAFGCIIKDGAQSGEYVFSVIVASLYYILGMVYFFVRRHLENKRRQIHADKPDYPTISEQTALEKSEKLLHSRNVHAGAVETVYGFQYVSTV